MERRIVRQYFPNYVVIVTTSAAPAAVRAMLEDRLQTSDLPDRRDGTGNGRERSRPGSKPLRTAGVETQIIESARGTNVYVHVLHEALLGPFHLTLLATTVAAMILSWQWQEPLLVFWLSLAILLTSYGRMCAFVVREAAELERALPA